MAQQVVVFRHPGFPDRFAATLIPGLHSVPTDQDPVSVVSTEAGEILAVTSRHVFTPEGLAYAEEWATKGHSTVFDVRVPDALQPDSPKPPLALPVAPLDEPDGQIA